MSYDIVAPLLAEARRLADYVVIDSPPLTSVIDALPVVNVVDAVVVVARLGISPLTRMTRLRDLLVAEGAPVAGVVLIGESPRHMPAYYSATPGARQRLRTRLRANRRGPPGLRRHPRGMSAARTGPTARFWVTAGVLCLSLVLGLIAGINPKLGLFAGVGLVFAAATIANVTLGLVLFTFISFIAALSAGSGANLTKLAGLLLFGSWYLSRLVRSSAT